MNRVSRIKLLLVAFMASTGTLASSFTATISSESSSRKLPCRISPSCTIGQGLHRRARPADSIRSKPASSDSLFGKPGDLSSRATSSSLRGGSIEDGTPPGLLRRAFPQFPWARLPDLLTYARCVAIPFLALVFYAPGPLKESMSRYGHIVTGTLFAFASFTDWLDGFLARRWKVSTSFGAFLDPVADKLMVSTALLLLSGRYGPIVALPAAVILAREIAVSALREWMAQKGLRDIVKVGYQGKVKTALTMVALTVLLYVPEAPLGANVVAASLKNVMGAGIVMLYMSAVVTVTSGSIYFKAAAPVLMEQKDS